jgi:hypothetical protein
MIREGGKIGEQEICSADLRVLFEQTDIDGHGAIR